jgi:type 1 glutamine amidotransferase
MKKIALVIGEPEYSSHLSMPRIAEELTRRHGYKVTLCVTSIVPDEHDFALSEFSHLEALADADLMVIYTRFRVLPDRQMDMIKGYLDSGRPVAGLRTSTHSFHFPAGSKWHSWNVGFGRDVFGTPFINHHGHSSRTGVSVVETAKQHPILQGVEEAFQVRSWLYHVLPLSKPCEQLLWGRPIEPECKPQENPVAWTTTHNHAKVFFTTLGHPADFEVPSFRSLVVNGIRWAIDDLG